MIAEEEIIANIRDMGYITVTPRKESFSYYKLADGTILRALVKIHALIPAPENPDEFRIISSNIINAYVPKEKRRSVAFQPIKEGLTPEIVEDDVESEVMREHFSVYDLSNGGVFSVKTVVGQIQKTKNFTTYGEPIYLVNATPIIKMVSIQMV